MYNFRLRSISLVVGYTLPIQAQRVIGLALVDDHIVLFPLYKNGLLAIISEERSSFLLEDLHTFTNIPSVQDLWLHNAFAEGAATMETEPTMRPKIIDITYDH